MKSKFTKNPGSKIELEVTLDDKEFKPYWDAAYERALGSVHLKGFRPGTAPKELADRAVDKDKVFEEAAHNAIRWSLDEISQENKWTFIDAPKIGVEDAKSGIAYKASLIIFPEIKLGNYKKIAQRVFAEKKSVVLEPKEIEEAMEWLRKSRSKPSAAAEGSPAQKASESVLRPLDDEFAKSLGKFENLEDLKRSVGEGVKMEKEFKERDRLRIKALEQIIADSKIDTPEIMVQKTAERLGPQLSSILKASGKSDAEIKKEIDDRARKNVESNLVLYKIAGQEKLEYNPEQGVESEKVLQYLESLANKS